LRRDLGLAVTLGFWEVGGGTKGKLIVDAGFILFALGMEIWGLFNPARCRVPATAKTEQFDIKEKMRK